MFFIPATTANDLRISIPDLIHYIIFLSYFLRKSQYFPFQCWVPNKGTTGTIFITSLVWHGPWLGMEPGTSRTLSQHSTTRLSRRRYYGKVNVQFYIGSFNFLTTSIQCSNVSVSHVITISRWDKVCITKHWHLSRTYDLLAWSWQSDVLITLRKGCNDG